MAGPRELSFLVLGTLQIIALMGVWTDRTTTERKLVWTLAVVFLSIFGVVLYFAVGPTRSEDCD